MSLKFPAARARRAERAVLPLRARRVPPERFAPRLVPPEREDFDLLVPPEREDFDLLVPPERFAPRLVPPERADFDREVPEVRSALEREVPEVRFFFVAASIGMDIRTSATRNKTARIAYFIFPIILASLFSTRPAVTHTNWFRR
jgi:hypothetical protein